jgi:hypothetical protein
VFLRVSCLRSLCRPAVGLLKPPRAQDSTVLVPRASWLRRGHNTYISVCHLSRCQTTPRPELTLLPLLWHPARQPCTVTTSADSSMASASPLSRRLATRTSTEMSADFNQKPKLWRAGKRKARRQDYLYKTLLCPVCCRREPPLLGRAFADRNCNQSSSGVSGLGAVHHLVGSAVLSLRLDGKLRGSA